MAGPHISGRMQLEAIRASHAPVPLCTPKQEVRAQLPSVLAGKGPPGLAASCLLSWLSAGHRAGAGGGLRLPGRCEWSGPLCRGLALEETGLVFLHSAVSRRDWDEGQLLGLLSEATHHSMIFPSLMTPSVAQDFLGSPERARGT